MVFPKRSHNMIFLVLSGKMIFLFNENVILFFRRKRKFDLSREKKKEKKIHGNMTFSLNVSKIWSFQKHRTGIYLFCNVWKDGILFFPKTWDFFFRRKMKNDLSQKTHGNMIFSVYMCKCYKYDITLLSKKAKIIFSRI